MRSKLSTITAVALGLALLASALLHGIRQTYGNTGAEAARPRATAGKQSGVEQVPDPATSPVKAGESTVDCGQLFAEAARLSAIETKYGSALLERTDEWKRQFARKVQPIYASSGNPEHLLVALLVHRPEADDGANTPHAAGRERFLELAANGRDPLLAHHGLLMCMVLKDCSPDLEQRLLEADRHNAESWGVLATTRHMRDDTAGALQALQGAAAAPYATSYWGATIELVERGLRGMSDGTFAERFADAVAAVAALPFATPTARMCATEAEASPAWADACIGFGSLRIAQKDTDIALLLGYSILEKTFLARGDTARAEEAVAGRQHVREDFRMWHRMVPQELVASLILSSEARMQDLLRATIHQGEIAGQRSFLRQELPVLLDQAGLDQRSEARQCLAGLSEE